MKLQNAANLEVLRGDIVSGARQNDTIDSITDDLTNFALTSVRNELRSG